MMKIGTGKVEISPKIGTNLAGYFEPRNSKGIHDPLFARALVLGKDEVKAAIIACDLIGIDREIIKSTKELIKRKTGINPANIIIHATHVHTGPATAKVFGTDNEKTRAYLSTLPGKIAEAVVLASESLFSATIGYGRGEENRISFNRRYLMKDGTIRTNPGFGTDWYAGKKEGNPSIVRPTGPIDPAVEVLRFKNERGETKALLVNFACHCDTVGGDLISADYPAAMRNLIQEKLGQGVFVLFLNGTSGNLNHLDFLHPEMLREGYFAHTQWMGELLGNDVLKICGKLKEISGTELKAAQEKLDIPRRSSSPLQLRIAEKVVEKGIENLDQEEKKEWGKLENNFGIEKVWAQEMILVNQESPLVEIEVTAISLGDVAIVGLPGEVFVEYGLRIKEEAKFKQVLVTQLCNGCAGYIPTKEAFSQPTGYEQRLARSSKLIPEAGNIITRTALDLLAF
ncbi:MAG: hypothetical protein COZ37_00295 [bacterium (Candidatus Ratteibacteria) CG_4_10_14_3_um_filter_41_18]|uniref:Neutral/alkaline non-lysosomal ceramidase N-terminal domain-containing protein n=1 Tax=bacterium (Candidatus Ratteibacteria) CG_4_10_14_3_um_filter_41_18 TaxID=2014287 RepID=A0A2M7M5A8_9BACT|nr:MAG: hypothetical protein COZ37_00295 [bacterium (Candidatus Ratteibacteria) CG_4_10_14_3_um_filter_41_18]